MRKHIVPLVVFLVLALTVFGSVSASEEIAIRFPRSIVGLTQHGNLLVVVIYQKDNRNRFIELEWDSLEGEGGSSAVEVTAENNGIPIAKDLVLSSGEYAFVATLYRNDGSKVVDRQTRFVTK